MTFTGLLATVTFVAVVQCVALWKLCNGYKEENEDLKKRVEELSRALIGADPL